MSEEETMVEHAEVAVRTVTVVQPETGEVFDLEKPRDAARAVAELKELEARLAGARRAAEEALIEESKRLGTKTLRYTDDQGRPQVEIKISGGPGATGIDAEILRRELTAAGCPEERITAAIKEEITETVDRGVARQLAGANPDYKAAVDKATYTFEKRYGVQVKT